MKYCPTCKITKELIEFGKNKAKVDGLQVSCKLCKKAADSRYYLSSKETQNLKRYANQSERIKAAKEFVSTIKRVNPCEDCKQFFHPVQMDFDHVEGFKVNNIANMVSNGTSIKAIMREIRKCNLVCANCHRLRTAYRQGTITLSDAPNMKIRATNYAGPPNYRYLTEDEVLALDMLLDEL